MGAGVLGDHGDFEDETNRVRKTPMTVTRAILDLSGATRREGVPAFQPSAAQAAFRRRSFRAMARQVETRARSQHRGLSEFFSTLLRSWIENQRLAIAVLGLLLVSASGYGNEGPTKVVDHLQDSLIEAMKVGPEIRYQGRYERLAPVIEETHRIGTIARITIGRYWAGLTNEQKRLYVGKLRKLSTAYYASKFKKFKGESFEFISEQELRRDQHAVITDLLLSDGERIRFNYVLKEYDRGWQIINVMAKGVSNLAVRRAEYSSIMARDGFEVLMAKMDEQFAEIRERQETEGT